MRSLLAGLLLAVAGAAFAADAPGVAQARVDYMLNCQGCHLPDGRGYPGKVPDLRQSLGRFIAAEGGREYLLRVPGAATAPIDDTRLATLVNWMVPEFSASELPPAGFVPYSGEEVGRLRRHPFTEVVNVRGELAARVGIPAAY